MQARREPLRPVQTRFRCAYASRLKLAANGNSLTHYTKGTPSPRPYLRTSAAPTACGHPVSGLFHSPRGVLFTFPSRYWSTIGHQGVFGLGGWSPRLRTGFHVPRPTHGPADGFRVRGSHPLRPAFPGRSARRPRATGPLRFRSPLLAESRLMSVPPGTEMFQFPGFAPPAYGFSRQYPSRGGLPHSDTHGSTPARGSPWLFAACHVLPRLLVPRHPPNALLSRGAPRAAAAPRPNRPRAAPPGARTQHTQRPWPRRPPVRHAAAKPRDAPNPDSP